MLLRDAATFCRFREERERLFPSRLDLRSWIKIVGDVILVEMGGNGLKLSDSIKMDWWKWVKIELQDLNHTNGQTGEAK